MGISNFFKATILIAVLNSCKVVYPKTEKDCLRESQKLIKIIRNEDYINKLLYLKKYETFKDYTTKDFQKTYEKLHEYLMSNDVNKLHLTITKDTMSIKNLENRVSFVELNFLDRTIVPEKNIFKLEYSSSKEDRYYILSYFKHSLTTKATPILPKN